MTLARCRELLGPTCELTDAEIEAQRDQLQQLARLIVTSYREKINPQRKNEHYRNQKK